MQRSILACITLSVFCVNASLAQRSNACLAPSGLSSYPYLAAGGATAWQKTSAITLYIVSPTVGGFTSGQITDIETALSNWSTTAGTNLSITNSVVTTAPSSPSGQYILVQFGDTSACGAGKSACTSWHYNTTTGYPTNSTISVNTSVGSVGIRPLMAHEIGHTYIIADCTEPDNCNSSTTLTIMDPDQVTDTSPTSPQCCDLDLIYAVTPQVPQGARCTQ
jgi:hypothetical protein